MAAPLLAALLLLPAAALARIIKTVPRPANPFLDPHHDIYNPLRYIASDTLTAIAVSLIFTVALIQTYWVIKYKTRFMLAMTIGCYTFTLGLALRFGLARKPESKGIFIAEYLFVVLTPNAFIAAEYVLLGRLARFLRADKYVLVPPARLTAVFVASDITTFLIQALGGSIEVVTTDPQKIALGSHVFLTGLALQLASFVSFTFIAALFAVRIVRAGIWAAAPRVHWYDDWRVLCFAMAASYVGIIVRSVYRVIENAEGFGGHLSTTESLFYLLDTLPLFIAISVYVPFWPGRYIRSPDARVALPEEDKSSAPDTPKAEENKSVSSREERGSGATAV